MKKQKYKPQNKGKKGSKGDKKDSSITGSFEGMKGNIFQLRSESKSLMQFLRMQDQLVRYCKVQFTKYSDNIKWMLKNLEERTFPEPVERKDITSVKVRERVFEKMIDLWMVRQEAYDNAKFAMFEVI